MKRNLACCVLGTVVALGLLQAGAQQDQPPQTAMQQAPDPKSAAELAAERQALGFLGYLDQGRYAESYAYTGMLLRAQADQKTFAEKVEQARAATGSLQARELIDANEVDTVPGAPAGDYVVLHYHASFANRPDAVETLTLAFANGYWRVNGYYIK